VAHDWRSNRKLPSEEASGAGTRATTQEVGAAAGGIWAWLKKKCGGGGASEEASGTGGALRHGEGAAPGRELGGERRRE